MQRGGRCGAMPFQGGSAGSTPIVITLSILKNALQNARSASSESLASEVGVLGLRCTAVAELIACLPGRQASVVHKRGGGLAVTVRLDLVANGSVDSLDCVRRISN